ncbi:hypothetical protein BT93_L4044 [Corymbia citriodora subsp. variegata]|uniref:ARGOS-like protein n=1 Tax=Corymbia citriodora subsp. variegata TaxID=360336 RepID=A0A8T0CUS1_CORYI|nr:hypothetical protein BT93_L4044 [Corymbia citriodora subsp. variegata]
MPNKLQLDQAVRGGPGSLMSVGLANTNTKVLKSITISQQIQHLMETRERRTSTSIPGSKKSEHSSSSSFSMGRGKFSQVTTNFSLEWILLLMCLTAILLILPLILPPLPPPPSMLLLLPIAILTVLMILAFMPSNVRDLTYTYS